VTAGFCREVEEIGAPLRYYPGRGGNSLLTLRNNRHRNVGKELQLHAL